MPLVCYAFARFVSDRNLYMLKSYPYNLLCKIRL